MGPLLHHADEANHRARDVRKLTKAIIDIGAALVLAATYFIVVHNIRKKRKAANAPLEGELVVLRATQKGPAA